MQSFADLPVVVMSNLTKLTRGWTQTMPISESTSKTNIYYAALVAQSKKASIPWSHREETSCLEKETMQGIRCMQARKTTHGLDGQHQDVYRTARGRVNQNDRGHG